MASSCLCISCTSLPVKERSAAARKATLSRMQVGSRCDLVRHPFSRGNGETEENHDAGFDARASSEPACWDVIVLVGIPVWIEEKTQPPHERAATVRARSCTEHGAFPGMRWKFLAAHTPIRRRPESGSRT